MALDNSNSRTILTHAVLIGLSPLIPIPFIDDLVQDDLERRLVRALADAHGLYLSQDDVEVLSDEPRTPWLERGAKNLVLYPVKKIFRKTFFLLGIKGMIDLAARSWHKGFLFDHAFAQRYCAPAGPHNPVAVRAAIEAVCREIPTTPVEPALRLAFEQSTVGLKRVFDHLTTALRRGPAIHSPQEADPALDDVTQGERWELDAIVARITRALSVVPDEHFARLRTALDAHLRARVVAPEARGAAGAA